MLINYKISPHLANDRAERIAYIGTTVGFGDVKYIFPIGERYEAITSTGVLIILGADKVTIVTMYLMNITKAKAIFSANNFDRIPPTINKIIMKNIQTGIWKNCP